MRITHLKKKLNEAVGKREVYLSQKQSAQEAVTHYQKEERLSTAALAIAVSVGEELQNRVSLRLSALATHMLAAVFPEPYEVNVKFSPSGRGGIDAAIHFERDTQSFKPILPNGQMMAGEGPIEMSAFGLRCALRSTAIRPVFLLDEPFRFLQKSLQPIAIDTLKEITEKTGIQLIIVTHEEEIAEGADNVIEIE